MEIIRGIEQGSEDWHDLRVGSVGASSLSKIITSTGKRSSQRGAYLYQVAAERITGKSTPSFCSNDMLAGIEKEPQTRMAFQVETWKEIEQVALIFPDGRPGYHVSPDGLIVGEEAGLEVKSVLPSTQIKRLDKGGLPTEYKLQCQMSMYVTDWPVWWFCSHCPGLPIFYMPVPRDEELISIISEEIRSFIYDVDKLVLKITS